MQLQDEQNDTAPLLTTQTPLRVPAVTVLFGGPSPEYHASIQSALGILEHEKSLSEHYGLVPCLITRDGFWLDRNTSWQVLATYQSSAANSDQLIDQIIETGKSKRLQPWEVVCSSSAVFPAMHGALGEDGVVLGLCQALQIPHVGCDILSSVTCLDKATCKAVLKQAGLPVTPHHLVLPSNDDDLPDITQIATTLPLPWLVKPSDGGCSIGASLVQCSSDLSSAITKCREHYSTSPILIEQFIQDVLEVDVAVMLDHKSANTEHGLVVTPCGLRQNFDFSTSSSASPDDALDRSSGRPPGMSDASSTEDFRPPARGRGPQENQNQGNVPSWAVPAPGIPEAAVETMQNLAKNAFRAVRGTAFLRVDFFYSKATGEVWINEINTMPSLARGCMMFKLWEKAGISAHELIGRWIEMALTRQE